MQIESLKVFRDLVDSQSFSKAAALNFITQSAVSQQIRNMEEKFKVTLLERSNKKFELSFEGKMLYETSKQILHHYDVFQNQLKELHHIVAGTIRVSTVYSIGLHELPPYIKKFLSEFPEVHMHVEYRRSNRVYEDVIEGTCDLGLVAFPTSKKGIKVDAFFKDRLVLICHPSNPLSKQTSITIKQLAQERFVGFESDLPTQKAIDKIFRQAQIEIRPVMEFDNIETVKRAVEINAGVSIVPRATVEQEIANATLAAIEFKGKPYHRPLAIIYKQTRILSPGMKHFIRLLKEPIEALSS